jgi:hypothetical protein
VEVDKVWAAVVVWVWEAAWVAVAAWVKAAEWVRVWEAVEVWDKVCLWLVNSLSPRSFSNARLSRLSIRKNVRVAVLV